MAMTKAGKAALFSAIIFPGAGLWWLKHYKRACIFIIPAIIALWYLTSLLYNAILPAYTKMLRDIEEGIRVLDINTVLKLTQEIHNNIAVVQSQLNAAQFIFIACWLCSIVSSYFVGKKIDLENSTKKTDA
jgi:hypothetical protein